MDDAIKRSTNESNVNNGFSNRVGVYIIMHMSNPFLFAGASGVAKMICDYLESRDDLGIDAKMLDKLVLVTCSGAGGLRSNYDEKAVVQKISGKLKPNSAQSQEHFAQKYNEFSKPWIEKRQKEIDKRVAKYEADPEKFFKKGTLKGNTMILFACALDKRGVHPKIAAWDSGLYVREDGRKSNTSVFDNRLSPTSDFWTR